LVLIASLLISIPAVVFSARRLTARGLPGWQSRTSMETIAESIAADAARIARGRDSNPGFVLLVYGEPGLFYQLSVTRQLSGRNFLTSPVGDLGFAQPNRAASSVPTFLVARRDKAFQGDRQRYQDRFQSVGRYPYRASDLVLLNEFHFHQLAKPSGSPQHELQLYLLKQTQ
jgi:hypothetical protein